MKFPRWQDNAWCKRLVLAASLLLVLLVALHPELRLLLPVVDALGLDLFLMLVAAQSWNVLKPVASMLYRAWLRPVLRKAYRVALFFAFGMYGPYAHFRIRARAAALGVGT